MEDSAPKLDIARLVGDHHEVLYRYAFRLTGSVPDAEDLTQQTFLVAQQKLHQVRAESGLRGWLFTVLRNCYLKGFRKQVPLPATNVELDIESIACASSEDRLDGELLQQALGELADEFKIVVMMFYFEERSYREIADALELPMGTVMSRLSRAKASLRRRLQESGTPSHPAGRSSNPSPVVSAMVAPASVTPATVTPATVTPATVIPGTGVPAKRPLATH